MSERIILGWRPLVDLHGPLMVTSPATFTIVDDIFDAEIPYAVRDDTFAVMALSKIHTFIVTTRNAASLADYLRGDGYAPGPPGSFGPMRDRVDVRAIVAIDAAYRQLAPACHRWPIPNIILAVRASTQAQLDERVPLLLDTPASVRAVWLTPSEDVRLGDVVCPDGDSLGPSLRNLGLDVGLDLVIVEGGFEPMHPDHVRSLRDQCVAAGVAFNFQGWGEWSPGNDGPGGDLFERNRAGMQSCMFDYCGRWNDGGPNPFRQTMDRVGAKKSGRELDGQVWDQWPKETIA